MKPGIWGSEHCKGLLRPAFSSSSFYGWRRWVPEKLCSSIKIIKQVTGTFMQMSPLGKMACFMFSLCAWTPHLHDFMSKLWHNIFTRQKSGYCEHINTVILAPVVFLDCQHKRSFETLSVGDTVWGLVLEPGWTRIQSVPLQLHCLGLSGRKANDGYGGLYEALLQAASLLWSLA